MTTENRDYNLPEKGESNWDELLNENFEDIDIDISDLFETKISNPVSGDLNINGYNIANIDEMDSRLIKTDRIYARNNIGEMFASEFAGDDLGEKVDNARQYFQEKSAEGIEPEGTIKITPRSDGDAWLWSTDVVFDVQNDAVELVIHDDARINYDGNGWALTYENGRSGPWAPRIIGGRWNATGNPDGWLRIKDCTQSYIHPREVNTWENDTGNATCISLENHENFCELTVIAGGYYGGDRVIDSKPVSVTGGEDGTSSFQATSIQNIRAGYNDFGIRCRGNWDYSHIDRPNCFPKNDGAAAFYLDLSHMRGSVITAFQSENVDGVTDPVVFRLGENYDGWQGAPMCVGGFFDGQHADPPVEGDSTSRILWMRKSSGDTVVLDHFGEDESFNFNLADGIFDNNGQIQIADYLEFHRDGQQRAEIGVDSANRPFLQTISGNDFRFNIRGQTFLETDGNTVLQIHENETYEAPPQDVTAVSSPSQGQQAYHEGSGGNTEGPAFYDGDNWISLVDGSTIT